MKAEHESAVVRGCLAYLQIVRRWPAWRNNSGAARLPGRNGGTQLVRFGAVGSSDILAVVPPAGRLLCVECKRKQGGKLRPSQAAFLDSVRAAGGLAVVVRSVDELIEALRLEGL